MMTAPLDANVPASPTDDNPKRPPQDPLHLPTMFDAGGGGNSPPDCPALVEQLAEFTDDLDALARCVVLLVGEIPRLGKPDAERALLRVGRMAERLAGVATSAALHAHSAVEIVRGSHKRDNGGDNGNGEAGGVQS